MRQRASIAEVTLSVLAAIVLIAAVIGACLMVRHSTPGTATRVSSEGLTGSGASAPARVAAGPAATSATSTTTATAATTAAPTVTATRRPASSTTAARSVGRTTPTPTSQSATGPAHGVPSNAGPAPAAPGTYRYHQVGSLPGTPAQGTLVIASASASGRQVWARHVGGTMAASTSVMLFNSTGSYLVSPGAQVAGAQASCTFATPVAWPPWPTTVGASVSAQASCSGPISSYHVTGVVQGTTTLSLDGAPVNAAVVVNTFVLKGSYAGSALNVTLTETDYYIVNLRVPVVTRTHVTGTAIGLPITTDRTDTLVSALPS